MSKRGAAAIKAVDRFVTAWNAHDPFGLAACFRPDGDFVNVMVEKVTGRDAIAEMHVKPFETVMARAVLSTDKLEFRELGSHFAAVDFWWKVEGCQTPQGESLSERHGLISFVVETTAAEPLIVLGRNLDRDGNLTRKMR